MGKHVVRLLLKHKSDPNIRTRMDGMLPLHLCLPRFMSQLCKAKADVNATLQPRGDQAHSPPPRPPPNAAVKTSSAAMKEALAWESMICERAAHEGGDTALYLYAAKSCDDVCKMLLERRADP